MRKPSPQPQPASEQQSFFTSKIVEWESQKGFGYLRHDGKRLFLHRKDFAERHKRPAVGHKIAYTLGTDPKGRRCAIQARHLNDGGQLSMGLFLAIVVLSCLPALSIYKVHLNHNVALWLMTLTLLSINALCYATYRSDKKKARSKQWRTTETELHLLSLVGGWVGALIAQRQFRHKCSKANFQTVFWLIVLMYQLITLDHILRWKIASALWGFFTTPTTY